ncbi:hypothetical protein AVEN_170058-1 [Araneus ventricosus]|uniref:Uncharacterized protein n=1 Tax=Araneus ventricosus TaxID=182803 RepID=A0A4Y2TC16_ARAVE|nr:hypothetical protein AVEN_170058-1 [Araneus ventricosus]
MSRCNCPAVYRQYEKGRHSFSHGNVARGKETLQTLGEVESLHPLGTALLQALFKYHNDFNFLNLVRHRFIATMSDYDDRYPPARRSPHEGYLPRDKKVTMRDLLRMMHEILEELRKLNAYHQRKDFHPQHFSPPRSPKRDYSRYDPDF